MTRADALPWPSCRDCAYYNGHRCNYRRRLTLPGMYEPAPRGVRSCCRFWRGPDGENRRERCRRVNWFLDDLRPSFYRPWRRRAL